MGELFLHHLRKEIASNRAFSGKSVIRAGKNFTFQSQCFSIHRSANDRRNIIVARDEISSTPK